ncbi:hypothetical protein EV702DRAFT_1061394 [Suillus placidus]|uniref:Transketolase C-terminal domain-containing protein n=1 Tax=Suillus placidus TaxID=48579 RepID=A0A9P7A7Z2_9AGAM|nr:hypothetical protein EV702DRAFT_1061394 [Suillus placidus]
MSFISSDGCCLDHGDATYNENSAAIRDPNPAVFLENDVEREGSDLTIVAHSMMVTHSMDATDFLAKEGIRNIEVINRIRPVLWMLLPLRHWSQNRTGNTSIQPSEPSLDLLCAVSLSSGRFPCLRCRQRNLRTNCGERIL